MQVGLSILLWLVQVDDLKRLGSCVTGNSEKETITALLRVFDLHATNTAVLAAAAEAVAGMCERIPASGAAFVAQGGLDRLHATMQEHLVSASLQAAGCRALGALFQCRAVEDMRKSRILVFAAMDGNIDFADVQAAGCRALHAWGFIVTDATLVSLATEVKRPVEAAIRAHTSSSAVTEAATALLQHMAQREATAKEEAARKEADKVRPLCVCLCLCVCLSACVAPSSLSCLCGRASSPMCCVLLAEFPFSLVPAPPLPMRARVLVRPSILLLLHACASSAPSPTRSLPFCLPSREAHLYECVCLVRPSSLPACAPYLAFPSVSMPPLVFVLCLRLLPLLPSR